MLNTKLRKYHDSPFEEEDTPGHDSSDSKLHSSLTSNCPSHSSTSTSCTSPNSNSDSTAWSSLDSSSE